MDGATTIVGRAPELAALDQSLTRLGTGAPALVTISGEAGIGKSALLDALGRRARESGVTVLRARAAERDRGVPLALLREALEHGDAGIDEHVLRALEPADRELLGAVLPSLGAPVTLSPAERHRLHRAVRALLEGRARRGPVVLVLDDVHWADTASAELLMLLTVRRWKGPLLVALAYRTHVLPTTLLAAIDRLVEEGDERLELGPLAPDEAGSLLPPSLDEGERRELVELAAGNPLFVCEMARAVAAGGGPRDLPRGVVEVLGRELGLQTAVARRAAHAAAVAGEPFDAGLVAAAAELEPDRAIAALEELAAADLVRTGSAGGTFEFRHPLLARAAYELVEEEWRRDAHARVAHALAARGAPLSARAVHLELSAVVGDRDAADALAGAAAEVTATAPRSAARWLDAALRLRDDLQEVARLELLVPLASALSACGELERCRAVLLEIVDLLPALPQLRVQALVALARVDHMLGNHAAAQAMLEDALAEVSPGSAEAVALELGMATAALQRGDYAALAHHARASGALARELGERSFEAIAAGKLALASYHLGDVEAARESADAAGQLVASLADAELLTRADALAWLGWAQYFLERTSAAIETFDRALMLQRLSGQSALAVPLMLGLAVCDLRRGNVATGLGAIQDASDAAHLSDADDGVLWAGALLCDALLLNGDVAGAVAAGEHALARSGHVAGISRMLCRLHLADARLAAGAPEQAREELIAAAGGPGLDAIEPAWRARWYEVLVRADLELGEMETADEHARRAEAWAAGHGLAGPMAEARIARSRVLLARGDGAEARAVAFAAVADAQACAAPVLAARARIAAAQATAACGERSEAAALLSETEAELARLGAEHDRELARAALRALGRRGPYRARAADPAGLTRREREVSELAASGLTNREVAETLVVSEHTVETHLRAAYRKLGVSGRDGLPDALGATLEPQA